MWSRQIPLLNSLEDHPVFVRANRFYILDSDSVFFLVPDTGIYAYGKNSGHRLGLAHSIDVMTFPELVQSLENYRIISIVSAGNQCCALTECGKVFTWGSDPRNRHIHPVPTWLDCHGQVSKIVCSFWFRSVLKFNGTASIYSLDDQPLGAPIPGSIDIGCTCDRFVILTNEDTILSHFYYPGMKFDITHYRIEPWLQARQLICSRNRVLVMSGNGSVYRCEFNLDGTIFAEPIEIDDDGGDQVSSCHGCIQHNTFVMVDRKGFCHVWNGDTNEIFHTVSNSVAETFFQYETTYTSMLIDI